MTKKSYKLIAESIKEQYARQDMLDHAAGGYAIRELTDNLATILKLDNPKFDRDKFLTDCGF